MLRRYAIAKALFAFTRRLWPITYRSLPACRSVAEGIRASSPAGETGTSEQAGADLPEAKDGEGQLSKDALRSPAPGNAPEYARVATQDAVSAVIAVSAISTSRSASTSSE